MKKILDVLREYKVELDNDCNNLANKNVQNLEAMTDTSSIAQQEPSHLMFILTEVFNF